MSSSRAKRDLETKTPQKQKSIREYGQRRRDLKKPVKPPITTDSARGKVWKKEPTKRCSKELRQTTLLPLRRSTRKCKSTIEQEEKEELAKRLKDKVEEGLETRIVEEKGRGIFSTRPFKKGELVCEYSGELVSIEEARAREGKYRENEAVGCYMYYFAYKDKKWCVDATAETGRLGRLVNHSKTEPNVVTKVVEVEEHPYLCLFAARDIKKDEELQYDYGERDPDVIASMPWLAT